MGEEDKTKPGPGGLGRAGALQVWGFIPAQLRSLQKQAQAAAGDTLCSTLSPGTENVMFDVSREIRKCSSVFKAGRKYFPLSFVLLLYQSR